MQCPECGVFCEIPEPAPRNPVVPKSRSFAEERLPVPTANKSKPDADDAARELALEVWSDPGGSPKAVSPSTAPETVYTNEDDGRPYPLRGGDESKCPECCKILEKDAALCPRCGFNLQTGKKAIRVYEPLELRWDAGLPFQRRLLLFLAGECVALVLALVGAFLAGHPSESVTSVLTFTVLTAFILGTFDRLDLTRNKRGRVVLTQTWRIFFWRRPTDTIALREYEGVVTNSAHETGLIDWIILIIALLFGIIPGLIWWFWAMQQDTFQVALTKDHGYPERILYRGWSQSRAKEIARTLHEVSGLPYEGVTD
jgi:hypothetical protein